MRFDPKIVQAEDPPLSPNGEIELPADLSALAQQLGDDAARLASCYPPAASTRVTPPSPVSRSRSIALAMAALGASALVVAIVTLIGLQGQGLLAIGNGQSIVERSPPQSFTSTSASADETVSLVELSGPELEAWLDLEQRQSTHPVSVSF